MKIEKGHTMKISQRVIRFLCLLGLWLGIGLQAHAQTDTVTYVYTDPQGTPLVKADASGNVIARYDYTPYGNAVTSLGSPPNGPGYTGHVNDPETGLVYMQARYYQPDGRFLSPDPVAATAGNVYCFNRYAYASNNPIINVDPDGRNATEALGGLFYESWSFATGNGFHGGQIWGALKDGYNGEGDGRFHAALQDIGTATSVAGVGGIVKGGAALLTRLAAKEAVEEIAAGGEGLAAKETTRVGRWMSQAEYDGMKVSGRVQESFSGTTHVASPADPSAFINQARPGSLYAEFNVPTSSLKATNEGWSKVIGPNSLEGRLAARKGLPIPEMPPATDIIHTATRIH